MIINTSPTNEAVMSNVGEIGEFRIRNSAKAFSILSSGLYSNKIRAIVRELSCNAVDSHIAAGCKDTPFDVHLPTAFEPHFAIRDYGTGLTHDQVTQIYTTYFESTKTNSNEFIGALGLGSKSPFSYTDNFTVTAICDGKKGIYSAFINDSGVPSIALMMGEETDEPAGVEVKFSVNDRYDFSKFAQEAQQVYTYFALRPVVSGPSSFAFNDISYETKDIIPGVHSVTTSYYNTVAVMGNIAYPINMPNPETNLGDLAKLLGCKLELNFEIGELDFQASREGLSYIPQTIAAIKGKLEKLNAALTTVLAAEADAIPHAWDKAFFLEEKSNTSLWSAASAKYVTDTKFPLIDLTGYRKLKMFKFDVTDLATKYNIVLSGFRKHRGESAARTLRTERETRTAGSVDCWGMSVSKEALYFINNTKTGLAERVKYHIRSNLATYTQSCNTAWILSAADKTKPMNTKAFFDSIHNPRDVMQSEALTIKPRVPSTNTGKDVTILKMEKKTEYGYRYSDHAMVWRDAGKADAFDSATTFYYLPLSGYALESTYGPGADCKDIVTSVERSGLAFGVSTVYGVRKTDIKFIQTQKNWINLEEHIAKCLTKIDPATIAGIAYNRFKALYGRFDFNQSVVRRVVDKNSKFCQAANKFKGVQEIEYSKNKIDFLTNRYAKGVKLNIFDKADVMATEVHNLLSAYPMLKLLNVSSFYSNEETISDYVNLVDSAQ
jgi:hypothetical protein